MFEKSAEEESVWRKAFVFKIAGMHSSIERSVIMVRSWIRVLKILQGNGRETIYMTHLNS